MIKPRMNDVCLCQHCGSSMTKGHKCVPMLMKDMEFLSDQLSIIEHMQDTAGIAAVRKKYNIKRIWEKA